MHMKNILAAMISVAATLVAICAFSPVFAASPALTFTINIEGESPITAAYSMADLQSMPQTKQIFSSLDQSPSPVIVMAEGIISDTFLNKAAIDKSTIQKITLKSSDNWSKTYTSDFLFQSNRFYYPSIVSNWTGSGFQKDADLEKTAVLPLLALKSSEIRYDTALDWTKMNENAGLRLCFGQKNIQDDVNSGYGKHIDEIEIYLTDQADYKTIYRTVKENAPKDADNDDDAVNADEQTGGETEGLIPDTLTIKVGYFGGPYTIKKVYTRANLEKLPQVEQAYTWIDKMPCVVMNSARGVKLSDILKDSNIDINSVETFYFYCEDVKSTWYQDLSKTYLMDTDRYYYPNLPSCWDQDLQAASFGAAVDAQKVETIIALEDNWARFAVKPNFKDMTDANSFRLIFGQTDTSTPEASRSAKWIHSIEVMLGGSPPKGVTLNKSILQLKVGSTFQLQAAVAGYDDKVDKRVTWSSSDPEAVKVDDDGNITILKEARATITVTTKNGQKTAVCIVNGNTAAEQKAYGKTYSSQQTGFTVSGSSGKQPWRVYEISKDAVAMPAPKTETNMTAYAGILFIIFYSVGAIIRFRKNKKETL
jgi:hypothetical protein